MAAPTADPRYTNGRIRLNHDGAMETLEALQAHINFLREARGTIVGITDATRLLNRRIEQARRVESELTRMIAEQGWSQEDQDGEPQRPQP